MVHYISLHKKPPATETIGRPISGKESRQVVSDLRQCADGSWLTRSLPEVDRLTSMFNISMEICEGNLMSVNQPLIRCLMIEVKANKGGLASINGSDGNSLVRQRDVCLHASSCSRISYLSNDSDGKLAPHDQTH